MTEMMIRAGQSTAGRWTPVCPFEVLIPERGVAALVDDVAVAVFRTHGGDVFALSNVDPFSGASVLSRGIVGDRGGRATVASPIYKQVFELATGVCLDDETVRVATYPARVVDGVVEVGAVEGSAVEGSAGKDGAGDNGAGDVWVGESGTPA